MEYRDYYEILGVPRDGHAGRHQEGIPEARPRAPSRRNPGDKTAEQRFKDVNEANAVLSDAEKRKQYDLLGSNWERVQRAGAPGGRRGGRRSVRRRRPVRGLRGAAGRQRPLRVPATGGGRRVLATSSGCSSRRRGRRASQRRRPDSRPTDGPPHGRPGPSFEDILAEMGLGANGAAAGAERAQAGAPEARPRGRARPRSRRRPSSTLEEAFHGHQRLRRGGRQAARGPDPARASTRAAGSSCSGKGPKGRDVVVTVTVAPAPDVRAPGRGPRARAPGHAARGAARGGGAGHDPQGPDPAHDPGRHPERADVPPHRPGHAAHEGRAAPATCT